MPDAEGVLRCGPSCIPDGRTCTTGADCCTGNCTDGSCSPPDVECLPLGATCTSAAECCSGECIDGTCQVVVVR
ncbi:MAG TPA: hypothetical protein VKZ49_01465 [Polyangiaceae bacterium]|nr:hypothetical protein [Polyangiaceae bacterium]